MDVPAEMFEELKCSRCEGYLSRGPVYLQHDGAAVCVLCHTPQRPATINTQYEAVARLLKFPCKNQDFGCPVMVPYVGQDEKVKLAHEDVCLYHVCPVLGSSRCDWLGPRAAMEAHCRAQLPDNVLQNPCSLSHNISKASVHSYIISALHVLFLLHTKVCVTSGKIFLSLRLLGTSDEAANYYFNLDIKRGDEQVTKVGQVVPEGCLAIQESTSLALDTNSLLDGTTFTVTVKRRVKCAGCAVEVTVFRYRGEDGWLCESCAPARRACRNQAQGCHHSDIGSKCYKHEDFFCQQLTRCYICHEPVPRGSWSAHLDTSHRNITHMAGSSWRATLDVWWQWFLVPSVAGTALCWYLLYHSQFAFDVFIPVASEQLGEYRCEVQVTDPNIGHTRTFTPDARYDEQPDWHILVNKEEFPSWSTGLDICVNIRKAEPQ